MVGGTLSQVMVLFKKGGLSVSEVGVGGAKDRENCENEEQKWAY